MKQDTGLYLTWCTFNAINTLKQDGSSPNSVQRCSSIYIYIFFTSVEVQLAVVRPQKRLNIVNVTVDIKP